MKRNKGNKKAGTVVGTVLILSVTVCLAFSLTSKHAEAKHAETKNTVETLSDITLGTDMAHKSKQELEELDEQMEYYKKVQSSEFDPFEYITLEFSGKNGKGVANKKELKDPAGLIVIVDIKNASKLSNGDKVDMMVTYMDPVSNHQIKTAKRTYKVSGLR